MRPCIKPTFLTYQKPLLCAMVQDPTPEEAILTICNALYDGAEAFGIQLECLKREYRNEETLRRIFDACEGRPIYITSYRGNESAGMTDEECVDYLLMGLRAGATLCDVMGDFYHQDSHDITWDAEAVEKQKALVDTIHALGGEVLMSSHIHEFLPEDEILKIALAQEERGADVIKIVNFASTEEELMADLHMIYTLKHTLKHPFLFLGNGAWCKYIRQTGPALGVCMYLCVERYGPRNSREQPLLRAAKAIRDNMA